MRGQIRDCIYFPYSNSEGAFAPPTLKRPLDPGPIPEKCKPESDQIAYSLKNLFHEPGEELEIKGINCR